MRQRDEKIRGEEGPDDGRDGGESVIGRARALYIYSYRETASRRNGIARSCK